MKLELIREEPASEAQSRDILFVHGMWHGAWCWRETFLPFFAQHGYRGVAVSLRGHGQSEGHRRLRWHTLSDYVEDVAQVAAGLDEPPIVVGHSMGGMVVQKYLETHEAPAAVLLAALPPGWGAWGATLRAFRRHPLAVLKVIATMRMYPVVSTPAMAREFLLSAGVPEQEAASLHARLQDDSFRAYMDMLGLGLPRPRRVKTPLLVLGGAEDTLVSPADVKATARAYGTEAEIFPGMAHNLMVDAGWEQVAGRILDFIKPFGPEA